MSELYESLYNKYPIIRNNNTNKSTTRSLKRTLQYHPVSNQNKHASIQSTLAGFQGGRWRDVMKSIQQKQASIARAEYMKNPKQNLTVDLRLFPPSEEMYDLLFEPGDLELIICNQCNRLLSQSIFRNHYERCSNPKMYQRQVKSVIPVVVVENNKMSDDENIDSDDATTTESSPVFTPTTKAVETKIKSVPIVPPPPLSVNITPTTPTITASTFTSKHGSKSKKSSKANSEEVDLTVPTASPEIIALYKRYCNPDSDDGEGNPKSPGKSKKKRKRPLDLDEMCGALINQSVPCRRCLTCKQHSITAKRKVPCRSAPFDILLKKYKHKLRLQKKELRGSDHISQMFDASRSSSMSPSNIENDADLARAAETPAIDISKVISATAVVNGGINGMYLRNKVVPDISPFLQPILPSSTEKPFHAWSHVINRNKWNMGVMLSRERAVPIGSNPLSTNYRQSKQARYNV